MTGTRLCISLLLILMIASATISHSESATYVGVKKCKMCHNRKDETKQFDIWQESRHSHAYETLGTEKAKEYAVKAGVEGNPQEAAECLECHVTGYEKDSVAFGDGFVMEDGVQCESCHGPGSEYKSAKIMSKKKYQEEPEAQHQLALKAGLIIPDEETCLRCHNKRSPAFKGFDFKEYYAKIAHEYKD